MGTVRERVGRVWMLLLMLMILLLLLLMLMLVWILPLRLELLSRRWPMLGIRRGQATRILCIPRRH